MVTVALGVSVFMLMLTGGFFAGPNLVLWFYFGITPATIFLITVVIINLLPGRAAKGLPGNLSKSPDHPDSK